MDLQYLPLDSSKSQIRVLSFSAPASDAPRPLEFTPRTVTLDDEPRYSAFSYVWGDPSNTEQILVDGQPFQATKNLVAFFRALAKKPSLELCLRRKSGSACVRPESFWADAICINQNDVLERNSQVALMGRIYKAAECVMIWLGSGNDLTSSSFALVNDFDNLTLLELVSATDEWNAIETAHQVSDVIRDSDFETSSAALSAPGKQPTSLSDTFLELFHKNRYWRRRWTFQEICLARIGCFFCGDAVLDLFTAQGV